MLDTNADSRGPWLPIFRRIISRFVHSTFFPRHLRTFADHFICPTTSKVNRVKRLSLTKEEEVRHVFSLRSSCTSGAIIDFPPELWRQNFFRRLRQLGNGLAALPTATVTRGREAARKAVTSPERYALVGKELEQIWPTTCSFKWILPYGRLFLLLLLIRQHMSIM